MVYSWGYTMTLYIMKTCILCIDLVFNLFFMHCRVAISLYNDTTFCFLLCLGRYMVYFVVLLWPFLNVISKNLNYMELVWLLNIWQRHLRWRLNIWHGDCNCHVLVLVAGLICLNWSQFVFFLQPILTHNMV